VYRHGWLTLCAELVALNLAMAVIAWRLPDDESGPHASGPVPPHTARAHAPAPRQTASVVETRVLLLSITMSLLSFGYGALTSFSALFADTLRVSPRGIFLAIMASAILLIRLAFGRLLDDVGPRRVLLACLAGPAAGLFLLAAANSRLTFVAAALVFGLGFGLMYPAYTAYVLRHVAFNRRGAAFGAMLAAFDTGVGSGSSITGWLIHRAGYRWAFVFSAALALFSLPYFLVAERALGFHDREDDVSASTPPATC
jgi:MFS family permease